MDLQFPILGVPVIFRTVNAEVARIVRTTFSDWNSLAPSLAMRGEPMVVEIRIRGNRFQSDLSGSLQYCVTGERFSGKSRTMELFADRVEGFARADVSPDAIRDSAMFRHGVLECLALYLITRKNRTPVHASGVVWKDAAFLFLGKSGSGKSTIAHAACSMGASLIAEDAVYLDIRKGIEAWGNPTAFHFRESARKLFPELKDCRVALLPNGKKKLVLNCENTSFPMTKSRQFRGRVVPCFLDRVESTGSEIALLDPKEVEKRICDENTPGFNLDKRLPEVANALSQFPGYTFKTGSSFEETLKCIRILLDLESGADIGFRTAPVSAAR